MSRVLLFADTHRQAQYFLDHVDPVARRKYVAILRESDLRGWYAESAIFLDGWYRRWSPVDANSMYEVVRLYGVEGIWEQVEIGRRNYAREQIGLKASWEPEFMWFHLASQPREKDLWMGSDESVTFRAMLTKDKNMSGVLRVSPRLYALPGLDDRKRTIRPFLGTDEDRYGEEIRVD